MDRKAWHAEVHGVTKSRTRLSDWTELIAATGSDSSDESEPIQPKIFLKGFTILEGVENILDSWEEVKIPTLTRVWKKLVPTLMDDFEGFKISVEEVTADVVEIERELELEVEPGYVTESLQCHDQIWTPEELLYEIYSWGKCCDDYWNDKKGFRMLHKFGW